MLIRKVGRWVGVGLVIYVSIAAVLYGLQRSFIYFPDPQRPEIGAVGLDMAREVELLTSDGLRLLAWYVPAQANRPLMLYFHGNGGNLQYRSGRLRQFAAAGMGILMPEYRGYGGNPGEPSEDGFVRDAEAALTFLKREGLAPERIIVYGESIGSGVATRVASELPVTAVVLESPFTSLTAMAARHYPWLPVGLLLQDRFDSASRIGRVRAPLLVLQGGRDTIVPPEMGRALFEAASEPKELWSAPEADHNDLYAFGAGAAVLAFLRRHVASLQ